MQESLAASPGWWIAFGVLLAAGLGFAIGRLGSGAARRARAAQLALAEERAAHDKLRESYEGYRKQVADHFTETSERLHDLTLQYRSVYEHLAKGASELCPQGFSKLGGGLGLDALPEETERAGASPDPGAEPPAPEGEPDRSVQTH
jgi:uncharacterized membrane-anchored protein YhcB (DUF1043 family)